MRKTIVLSGILAAALVCGTAMAQTANPPADQGAPPPSGTGAGAPPDQSAPPPGPATGAPLSNKDLVASCRKDAQAKGLRGDALRSAIGDCVSAQNPRLGARIRCVQQGKSQGVAAGDAMKAFVRNCVAQGQH